MYHQSLLRPRLRRIKAHGKCIEGLQNRRIEKDAQHEVEVRQLNPRIKRRRIDESELANQERFDRQKAIYKRDVWRLADAVISASSEVQDKLLPNYYQILNVDRNASDAEIRSVYRQMFASLHPD